MNTAARTTHADAPLPVWWLDAPAPGEAAALRLLAEDASCCWFADPAAGEKMLGIGVARDFSEAAAQGPAALARCLRTLRVRAHGAVRHGGALLLGAMPFDPARPAGGAFGEHAAARWVIPRVTFVLRGGDSFCAVAGYNLRADAEALRDAELARLERAAQQADVAPAAAFPGDVAQQAEAASRARNDDTTAAHGPLPINVTPGADAAKEPASSPAHTQHTALPKSNSHAAVPGPLPINVASGADAATEADSLPAHTPHTAVPGSLPINVAPGADAATEADSLPAHTPHTPPHPAFEESPEAFRARVGAALEAVSRGALHKVVPARARCIRAQHPFDPAQVAARLFAAEPHALHYAVPLPAGLLLGATPERLLRVAGERVLVDALAGTARRGHTEQADAAAEQSLRESKKDQEEHAWTRAAIQSALAAHLDALEYPEAPRVLSTSALHHLHTPFVGRRSGPSPGALELAALLHPTPAVAGAPRAAALAWLRTHELLARGAYAGPVGWVDLTGEGALGVALRCALLQGERAVLFAGAGVVEGSQPAAEFEETQIKLRTMEAALLGE